MSDPVGYYCDHSGEPIGERTHHEWNIVDDQGWVFEHKPNTLSAHAGLQDYLTPEQQKQRCPRADAVYPAPVLEQARRIAAELEQQLALATELAIPVPGGLGTILLLRREPGVDEWAIRDTRRPTDYWVDGRWQDMPRQISLGDCYPHPLHEALDIAQWLAEGGN